MKKIKTELGEIELGGVANVINNTSDVIKVPGENFSGSSWNWVDSISKNLLSKDSKEAINICNELKDQEMIEKEGVIWKFKKEV